MNALGAVQMIGTICPEDAALLVDRGQLAKLEPALREVLQTLKDQERDCLVLYYGLDGQRKHSGSEIATAIDRSTGRVYQVLNMALRKMRHPTRRRLILRALSTGVVEAVQAKPEGA